MTDEVVDETELEHKTSIVVKVIDALTDNMISLMVFASACFLWVTLAPVPELLQNLVLVIAGFYYGKK